MILRISGWDFDGGKMEKPREQSGEKKFKSDERA
jgi:hypothetical protein